MYRVVFHTDVVINGKSVIMTNLSTEIASYEDADAYLDVVMGMDIVCGGDIQEYVKGIGWIVAS
jgi:hypothetical protein